MAARGAHETGGAPRRGGRALLSRGLLKDLLTWTPSLQDHILPKKPCRRRFHSVWTPFDIPFLRNIETGNKTAIWVGPPVNRLVSKMI